MAQNSDRKKKGPGNRILLNALMRRGNSYRRFQSEKVVQENLEEEKR